MKRLLMLLPIAIFVALCLIFFRQLGVSDQLLPSPLLNHPFPAFQLSTFTATTANDDLANQQRLLGGIHLVNVWASWCQACRQEHEFLVQLSQRSLVDMLGINYKDQRVSAQGYLKRFGDPFQYSFDDHAGTLGIDLGVYGVPETYVVDSQGIIRLKWVGAIDENIWQQQIWPTILQLRSQEHARADQS